LAGHEFLGELWCKLFATLDHHVSRANAAEMVGRLLPGAVLKPAEEHFKMLAVEIVARGHLELLVGRALPIWPPARPLPRPSTVQGDVVAVEVREVLDGLAGKKPGRHRLAAALLPGDDVDLELLSDVGGDLESAPDARPSSRGEGRRCRRLRQAHSKEAPPCMSALCASS
jgi:hypothetical protein